MPRDDRLTAILHNVASALNARDVDATVDSRPVLVTKDRWIPLGRRAPLRPAQRIRLAQRPRERRAAQARTRRTATSRDDGPSGPADPEPAELGPQLDWRHHLAGKYAHGLVPKAVRD